VITTSAPDPSAGPVPTVDIRDAARRVQRGAVLVDVRETDEWDAGHIHEARHLPLSELPAALGELPAGADILVICQAGGRSQTAAGMLARSGRRAVNVDGGMSAWMRAGLPVVTRHARPGRVR